MTSISTTSSTAPSTVTPPDSLQLLQGDAVVRATGILGLGAVGAIHLSQVVPTMEQTPGLGVAFVLLIVGCCALVFQLLHRGGRMVWAEVALLNAAAIGGFIFTRVLSTSFFDNQDVGNWSEGLGVVALFVEGLLFLLSVYALARTAPASRGAPSHNGHVS